MLCVGLTVYSPLVREGAGPGTRVAVIGIGGLGYFAVMFAAALGAEVTAISRGTNKKEDCLKMGAKSFIDSAVDGWEQPHQRAFDLVINTSFAQELPLETCLTLLEVRGTLVYVGIPEGKLPRLQPEILIGCNGALRAQILEARRRSNKCSL